MAKAGEFQPSPRVSSILNIRTVVSSYWGGAGPEPMGIVWAAGHLIQIVVKNGYERLCPRRGAARRQAGRAPSAELDGTGRSGRYPVGEAMDGDTRTSALS
jgi:hypothetical protein